MAKLSAKKRNASPDYDFAGANKSSYSANDKSQMSEKGKFSQGAKKSIDRKERDVLGKGDRGHASRG